MNWMCPFQNFAPLNIFQEVFVSLKKKKNKKKVKQAKKEQPQSPNRQPDMEVAL